MSSTSRTPGQRVNHFTARPSDEYTWRPLQRSTRAAVAVALLVTLYYVIFLLKSRIVAMSFCEPRSCRLQLSS